MSEHVHIEERRGVGIIRVDRPPANAIDLDLAVALARTADTLATSPLRAFVLTGAAKCFSAGVDLKLVPGYTPEQQREMLRAVNRLVAALYACPAPLVAALNGHAIGGGLCVALCADYRVCTSAPCKLALAEARAGVPFPAGPMAVVRAELRPDVARVLTLQGLPFDPERALAAGVVDELAAPERVVDRAVEVAEDMASMPREPYARIKRQLRADGVEATRRAAEGDRDPMLEQWLG